MPSTPPMGRVLTAMVTPMHDDGSLDLDGAQALATHLVEHGHDGVVVNGTTGESATTTDEENVDVVRAVVQAVGDRAHIVAGVGTNDTAHSVRAAKAMAAVGATGALIVTPYYNKPPQEGVYQHFAAVASATDLPAIVYDIPGRTVIPVESATLLRLADHPNIVAVKDAKGDLLAASELMAATDLYWYSGEDALNLAYLALGATGVVSVVGHVAGSQYAAMVRAVDRGDLRAARTIHTGLLPAVRAVMTITQGAIMAKAAMKELGVIASAHVRLPLVEATPDQVTALRAGLRAAGLL